MRILLDIVHPAHVHFFRHLRDVLHERGHTTHVVAREKDVTLELLAAYDIPYETVGRAGDKGMAGQAWELLRRDGRLLRRIRSLKIDLVLTRNPSGAQAAWLARIPSVFDTDDGTAVGIHYRAAAPFATIITTPDSIGEDLGPKHRVYAGYKALAYLHPNYFTPDPSIREELGLDDGRPLFVVRFVALQASHDRHISGLGDDSRRAVVQRLSEAGHVLISSEAGGLSPDMQKYAMKIAPHRMHDLLAAADLCVGDSQTVAIEAGLLGTPAIRLSSFSGRVQTLQEPEDRYGLLWNYRPGEEAAFMDHIERALADLEGIKAAVAAGRERMLADKIDVTAWYADLVEEVDRTRTARRQR